MGGIGSGRWDRDGHGKKTSVQQSHLLDANRLARDSLLRVGVEGGCLSIDPFTQLPFYVWSKTILSNGSPFLLLYYHLTDLLGNQSEDICASIPLQTTRPHFGGLRFWFTCPLTVGGIVCNRRVGKLYLPPGARFFGCRHCHRLVYRPEPSPFEVLARAERRAQVIQEQLDRVWHH